MYCLPRASDESYPGAAREPKMSFAMIKTTTTKTSSAKGGTKG
jgi:hypothetical protein